MRMQTTDAVLSGAERVQHVRHRPPHLELEPLRERLLQKEARRAVPVALTYCAVIACLQMASGVDQPLCCGVSASETPCCAVSTPTSPAQPRPAPPCPTRALPCRARTRVRARDVLGCITIHARVVDFYERCGTGRTDTGDSSKDRSKHGSCTNRSTERAAPAALMRSAARLRTVSSSSSGWASCGRR
jgi:hypothetical protein